MNRPVSLIGYFNKGTNQRNNNHSKPEQPRDIHGNIIVFPQNTQIALQQKQVNLFSTMSNNVIFENKQKINNNYQQQINTIQRLRQGNSIGRPLNKITSNNYKAIQKPILNIHTHINNNLNSGNHLNNNKQTTILTNNIDISPLNQKKLLLIDKPAVRPLTQRRLSALETRAKSLSPKKRQPIRSNHIPHFQSNPVKSGQLTQFYKQSIEQQVIKSNQKISIVGKNKILKQDKETKYLNSSYFPMSSSVIVPRTNPSLQQKVIPSQTTILSNSHFFNTMSKIQNKRLVMNTQPLQIPIKIEQKLQKNDVQVLTLKKQIGVNSLDSNGSEFTSPQIRTLMITKQHPQSTSFVRTINKQTLAQTQQITQQNGFKKSQINKSFGSQIPIFNKPNIVVQYQKIETKIQTEISPVIQITIDQKGNQYIQINTQNPQQVHQPQTNFNNYQQIQIDNIPLSPLVPESFPLSDIQYYQNVETTQNNNNQHQVQGQNILPQQQNNIEEQDQMNKQQQIEQQIIISTQIHETVITSVTINQVQDDIVEVLTTEQILIRETQVEYPYQEEKFQMNEQYQSNQILILDEEEISQNVKQSYEQKYYEAPFEQNNEGIISSSVSIGSQSKLIQAKITEPLSFSPNKFSSVKNIVGNPMQNIIKQTNQNPNDNEHQGYSCIQRIPVINSLNYQGAQIVD